MRLKLLLQISIVAILAGVVAAAQAQEVAGGGEGAGAGATQPASTQAAATAPAKPLAQQVEEALPSSKFPFEFSDVPVAEVIATVAKSYGLRVIDPYQLKDKVTMRIKEPLSARDAITVLGQVLLPLGYTIKEEVLHTEPPVVQLRIVKTTDQANVPIFNGGDPQRVPQGDDLRTQVVQLTNLEADKARELIMPVLDKKAEVVANSATRTIIITDSASHIRTALSLIQVMEKQAAESKAGK